MHKPLTFSGPSIKAKELILPSGTTLAWIYPIFRCRIKWFGVLFYDEERDYQGCC